MIAREHSLNDIMFAVKAESTLFEFPYSNLETAAIEQLINESIAQYQDIPHVIDDKAFLWCAKKTNFAPIYIFGVMHEVIIDIDDVFGDPLRNILSQVEICFNEVLDEDFFNSAADIQNENKFFHQLDTHVAVLAHAMKKKLKVLEDEIVRKIIEKEKYVFHYAFTNTSLPILTNDTKNYLQYILPTLRFGLSPSTGKRNCFWMRDILQESKNQHASLVVCGAAHTIGRLGLPNLLKFEGYTLTPLMTRAPTPRSKIMKRLLKETTGLHFFAPAPPPVLMLEHINQKSSSLVL